MNASSINSIICGIFLLITCSLSLNLKTGNLNEAKVSNATCYVQTAKNSCESKKGCFWRPNHLGALTWGCHATQLPK